MNLNRHTARNRESVYLLVK